MDPHYRAGQYYMVNKFIYLLTEPKQGDVVYFESPDRNDKTIFFIKRVIGLPGDRIKLQNGHIYVNDTEINQNYFIENNYIAQGQYLREGLEKVIPENQYFTIGDNPSRSSDSRDWGPIPTEKIAGKMEFCYYNCN